MTGAELERIRTFLRTVDERVADVMAPSSVGVALLVPGLPMVWRRVNVLRVDSEEADAFGIAEEAGRLLGGAGLTHRTVVLRGGSAAATAGELRLAGWALDRELVLVHRHRELPPSEGAEEVHLEQLESFTREFRSRRHYGSHPSLLADLTELDRRYTELAGARHFAARANGEWAAGAQLFSYGGIGEIHAVGTLDEHRGQGLAKTVIARVLAASSEAGNDLTFLQTAASDWPQHLYRSMGFENVGVFHELYRFHDPHMAPRSTAADLRAAGRTPGSSGGARTPARRGRRRP